MSMPPLPGSYHCDCSRYCKYLRKVSKATFYNHAKYRTQDRYHPSGSSKAHSLSVACVLMDLSRCRLLSDSNIRLNYRSQPDSATWRNRSHSPSAPSRKRIRAELDLPHPSVGSDPSAQAQSDERTLDERHSGFDGSPGPTEQDELTADQPRPEADLGGTGSSDDPGDPPLDESHEPHDRDVDADGTQAGDGHAYAGQDVQPDDFPGGPNDWNPDDFVPHLDAMRRSVEFIQGIRDANLDNDPLPIDVRER